MGWSQTDLARRLNCDWQMIKTWESEGCEVSRLIEEHINVLEILEKQAQSESEQISQSALADVLMEETSECQIDCESVKHRFFNN